MRAIPLTVWTCLAAHCGTWACSAHRAALVRASAGAPTPQASAGDGAAAAPQGLEAALTQAQAAKEAGEYARVLALLQPVEDAVRAHALVGNPNAQGLQVRAAVLRAQAHLEDDGNLTAAQDVLEETLLQWPQDERALLMLARVKEAQGQPHLAEPLYARLMQARPFDEELALRWASVALTLGLRASQGHDAAAQKEYATKAQRGFSKAAALGGDKAANAMGEARAAELLGDAVQAEAAWLRWVALSGDTPEHHAALADYYDRTGQHAKADRERRRAGTAVTPQKRVLRPLKPSR